MRIISTIQNVMVRHASLFLFGVMAIAMSAVTLMSAIGILPWLELQASWGGETVAQAGMYAQIALTILTIGLCFILPSGARVMALENSHRQFKITMDDIANAYTAVHSADRDGVFEMKTEFDQVRERLHFLRTHPDLGKLENDVLEVAAQMSQTSKDLADIYSDENVTRARSFLKQRQEEMDRFQDRLSYAQTIGEELKRIQHDLDMEEQLAAAQTESLREELAKLVPELARDAKAKMRDTVVKMSGVPAE